ncbi:MAG: 5'-nucleotidase C-terminal domain-containing protein, partial [Lachnospiraceae bacterium]|nr:5'-nucleotidase C-terminal domain-containing protein [Lachnospiraceae bacterium]
DSSIPSTCTADANNMFTGVTGKRRVSNVKVGDTPIDPNKKYSVAGIDYVLKKNGDGLTAFNGAEVLKDQLMLDNQLLIDYITKNLKGTVSEEYADPYGQGRIKIKE